MSWLGVEGESPWAKWALLTDSFAHHRGCDVTTCPCSWSPQGEVPEGGRDADAVREGGCLLLSGLGGLWGHELMPDLCICVFPRAVCTRTARS